MARGEVEKASQIGSKKRHGYASGGVSSSLAERLLGPKAHDG
jgi:hypothetical protein